MSLRTVSCSAPYSADGGLVQGLPAQEVRQSMLFAPQWNRAGSEDKRPLGTGQIGSGPTHLI